jgi:hypothetical protein
MVAGGIRSPRLDSPSTLGAPFGRLGSLARDDSKKAKPEMQIPRCARDDNIKQMRAHKSREILRCAQNDSQEHDASGKAGATRGLGKE